MCSILRDFEGRWYTLISGIYLRLKNHLGHGSSAAEGLLTAVLGEDAFHTFRNTRWYTWDIILDFAMIRGSFYEHSSRAHITRTR